MHLTERAVISLVVEVLARNVRNILLVDPLLVLVKSAAKVNHGVKKQRKERNNEFNRNKT